VPRYPPIYRKIGDTALFGCILASMAQEIEIGGVSYVSSKRASHISGYAQDYIGQLCRSGLIQAQRIGGLWYLTLDSLYQYKQKADSYVPVAPRKIPGSETESLIAFDGKDYISAARAAEITGYHQDYVGQLAREGKVLSRQVGSRWYVERVGILAHKKEKDALLAAVQTEAVGIFHPDVDKITDPGSPASHKYNGAGPYLTYTSDEGDLLPKLEQKKATPAVFASPTAGESSRQHLVPIRVLSHDSLKAPRHIEIPSQAAHSTPRSRQNRKNGLRLVLPATAIVTIVIFLAVGYTWPGAGAIYTRANPLSNTAASGLVDTAYAMVTKIGDMLERLLVPELEFKRANSDFQL